VALIAQYRDSGLTQRAFAGREGIKFSTFTSVCWLTRAIGSPAASNVSVRPGALQSDLIVSNAMSE
jgi:hypothetical protein